jgi:hypothetical protein
MNEELPTPTPIPGINPNKSVDEWDVVQRYEREEHERCDPIDRRIKELETEFQFLAEEHTRVKEQITTGKFSIVKYLYGRHLRHLTDQMDINRDLRKVLYKRRGLNS